MINRRQRRTSLIALGLAVILLVGCGGSGRPDAAVREHLVSGVAAIESTPDAAKLEGRLVATIQALRRDRARTPAERRGRRLALEGFAATLRGVRTQLAMHVRDSGKLEAAVRDARHADRYLNRGARLLRAAGRALGAPVGLVNGR